LGSPRHRRRREEGSRAERPGHTTRCRADRGGSPDREDLPADLRGAAGDRTSSRPEEAVDRRRKRASQGETPPAARSSPEGASALSPRNPPPAHRTRRRTFRFRSVPRRIWCKSSP
jgi:hypothetical protein